MKPFYAALMAGATAILLLFSCKPKEAEDPYNPNNYYNQPPLGKDTIHATAQSINLDRGGYFSLDLVDDADGKAYDLTLPGTTQDYGRCYLIGQHFVAPQTVITRDSLFLNGRYLTITHPNAMALLEVDMTDYNIKLTIGVKKVYVRITDATTFTYQTFSQSDMETLLATDTASRRKATDMLESQLVKLAGPEDNKTYCLVKPYFQRK